jgi:hypothetical protein
MEDILPEAMLEELRDHYYAGVTDAEIGYEHNARKEDSVTGALGHALLTRGIRFVQIDGQVFGWRASHEILGGGGKDSAEHRVGADGVFQLQVFDEAGRLIRRKALPFQAKKEWRGANKKLFGQAEDMLSYSPSAIVVDYRTTGFRGVAAEEVVRAVGNRRNIATGSDRSLAEILGDEFVRCRRGDVGLFWNPLTQAYERDDGFVVRALAVNHAMTTTVQRLR